MSRTRLVVSKEHNDLFWEVAVDGTDVTFAEGPFGGQPTETTSESFDSAEAAEQRAEAAITEKREAGWQVLFEQDPLVAGYYREGFLQDLLAMGLKKKVVPTTVADVMPTYYGVKFPAELRQFLKMRDDYDFEYQDLGEWRIWGEDVWLPDPEEGNLAEQIICMDQRNYLGTTLLEFLCCCVYLGSAGNGDCYFASVHPGRPDNVDVVFWNHETNDLEFYIADSISTLAFANHLLAKVQGQAEEDLEGVVADFERIAERATLSWHYNSLEEVAEKEASFKPAQQVARYFFYRTLWLNFLLRNDGVHELEAVSNVFGIVEQATPIEDVLSSYWLTHATHTAFHWLWRLFFFNKEEALRKALELTKAADNPMIRDTAILVEQCQDGRKQLGTIEDIHALREKFLELDLDPDRAEAREREKKEAEEAAARQKAADEKLTAELIAANDPQQLTEIAWEHVGNETIINGIYDHLREADASLREDFERVDFIIESRCNRDGCSFREENEDALEALAACGSPRLVPLLLTASPHFLETAGAISERCGERRTLEQLRGELARREKYHHRLAAAVAAVGALRATDCAAELVGLLDELMYDPDDFKARITNKEIVWAVMDALGRIGDASTAAAPLCRIIESGHKDLVDRAIVTLGRVCAPGADGTDSSSSNATTSAAVDCLLARLHGSRMRPVMYALAKIGDERALAPMRAVVEGRRGCAERLVYERVMVDALQAAVSGEPASTLENARFALGVIEASKFECAELHEMAIKLIAQHAERDEGIALIKPMLDADKRVVRRVAVEALAALGEDTPLRYCDRATVDALFVSSGVDGLRQALVDPDAVLKHNIVYKAVDEGCGDVLTDEIILYGETLLRFEYYSYTYPRDKWDTVQVLQAIAKIGTEATDAFVLRVLTHPNTMIRGVFEYGHKELKERLAPGGALQVREPAARANAPKRELTVQRFGSAPWVVGAMVNGLAFLPGGEQLLAVGGQGGAGGAAVLFDRQGNEVRSMPAVRGWSYDVDIHPDGEIAAMGLHAGHLLLVQISTGEVLADLQGHGGVPDGVRKVRFSPSGKLLASASDDESLIIWDVQKRELIRRVNEKFDVNTVDWFPDEKRVVFGTDKQVAILVVDDEEAEILRVNTGAVAEVRVFADGTRIAAGGSRETIVIFDDKLAELETLAQANVARIRLSADEQLLFAGSWEGEDTGVSRWDLKRKERTVLPGHDAAVFALDLDPQSGQPYAGGKLSKVCCWNDAGELCDAGGASHGDEVCWLLPAGDEALYSAAEDGSVVRWSIAEAEAEASFKADGVRADAVALSPDKKIVAVTGSDGAVAFDAGSGEQLWHQTKLGRSEIAFGVEGAFVVGSQGALAWLDAASGEIVHTEVLQDDSWLEHLHPVSSRSSSSKAIVAGYRNVALQLWDLQARRREQTIELPPRAEKAEPYGMGVGGGKHLVVSRWDRSFDVLDIDPSPPKHRFAAYALLPHAPVAVSPDGALVAAGEEKLRIFDVESFEIVGEVSLGHAITSLAFLAERRVAIGLKNGQVVAVQIGD